ncbi:MAG: hypothetical protein N2653_09575 [Burkholderiales bacterium]|nr:hypothetical protein [Burkholderiales bacterium]
MRPQYPIALAAAVFAALAALAPARASEPFEGWVFLGRRAGGEWRPPAPAVGASTYPLEAGDTLVLRHDALYYSDADCRAIAAADFESNTAGRLRWMVRAGAEPLRLVAAPLECPSAGGARTVWAKVRVAPERLYSVEAR